MKHPDISVIICTYNRSLQLRKALQSIKEMVLPENLLWELVLVDNNSNDDTKDVAFEFRNHLQQELTYIFEGRQGKSFALNSGVKAARGDILAFTDDDITVDRGWLYHIKKGIDELNCIGVGGRIISVWDVMKPKWLSDSGPYRLMDAIVQYDLGDNPCIAQLPLVGANMAFRRIAFDKYGLFRTDLGPKEKEIMRAEDTEFCLRLFQSGEKLAYAPDAIVYHPVEKERTEKKYFESFYFNFGKAESRLNNVSKDTIRYFGVPRYLVRNLVECALKWSFALHEQRRFYYKLQSLRLSGAVIEAFGQSKRS